MEDCADDLGEVGRGYAERILAASGQMSALIDGLLVLSRIARAEMHPEWVDLGAEVARIAADLQARRTRSAASISLSSAQSRPGRTASWSAPSCRTWWRTPGSSRPARMTR